LIPPLLVLSNNCQATFPTIGRNLEFLLKYEGDAADLDTYFQISLEVYFFFILNPFFSSGKDHFFFISYKQKNFIFFLKPGRSADVFCRGLTVP
jgi:hypothetical protein